MEAGLANRLDQSISNRALALRNLVLLQEDQQDQVAVETKRFEQEVAAYEDSQTRLATMFQLAGTTSEETTLLEQIRQQGELAQPLMEKAKELALSGQKDAAYHLLRFDLRPVQAKWWDYVRKLRELERTQNDEETAAAKTSYASSRALMLALSALALLGVPVIPVGIVAIKLDGENGARADIGTAPPEAGAAHEIETDMEIRMLHAIPVISVQITTVA